MNNEPVAWMNKTATSWVSTFIHPETEPDEWIPLYTHEYERPHNTVLVPCDKLAEMQAEIEALKKQVDRKDNSIMALDMMIAQFEDKFGDYEKVINGVYSKVKPHEFIEAVKGKENIVGTPIMYAEWPIRNDK